MRRSFPYNSRPRTKQPGTTERWIHEELADDDDGSMRISHRKNIVMRCTDGGGGGGGGGSSALIVNLNVYILVAVFCSSF